MSGNTSGDPASFASESGRAPAPEDAARANFYGLLARLYYAAPDAALLAAIAGAGEIVAERRAEETGEAPLPQAWRELTRAAAAADAGAVAEEYDALFQGVGKAAVSLYAGAYLMKSAADSPLADVRGYLAAYGLARRQSVSEPEDHFASLLEVMRYLVLERRAPVEEQSAFFMRFLWPASAPLCAAIERAANAYLYKQIAAFTRSFLRVEFDAFRM